MATTSHSVEQKLCRICGGRCCGAPMGKLFLYKGDAQAFDGKLPIHTQSDGRICWVDLTEGPDRKCPNLVDGRCSVYRKRPYNCQHWPYANTSVNGCMVIAWRQQFGEVVSEGRSG
jgi:Fe-S-cluster containining protein